MMSYLSQPCPIESLCCYQNVATVDVLRLDKLDPVISGNKWFKLKNFIDEARSRQQVILTFGGAYSNHIVATAAAAKQHGLQSIGIIRGEKPTVLSHTLLQAKERGMKLFFTSREAYRNKEIPAAVYEVYPPSQLFLVPEGGYGLEGARGAMNILLQHETEKYTHIITAVGTGTTLAGLTLAAKSHQKLLGVSALKNNFSLQHEVERLVPLEKQNGFVLLHDYNFGGYAKKTAYLLSFMNEFFSETGVPTDFVYTAKAFYAVTDLLHKGYFTQNSRLLVVHTGGLQGNHSLPKGTLIFG